MRINSKSLIFSKKKKLNYKTIITSKNRYFWCDLNEVDSERESRWYTTWQLNFLSIELRNFGFKLFNNYLKFNSSISHFSENVSAACTFCTVSKALPAPKETISHFCLNCPTVVGFVSNHFNNLLANTNIQFEQNFMLLGASNDISGNLAMLINIEILIVSLFLFNTRLRNKIPLDHNFSIHIKSTRDLLLRNAKYRQLYSCLQFDPG